MGISAILKDGAKNPGELDELADYIDENDAIRSFDKLGPVADLIVLAAVVTLPAHWVRVVFSGWMCFGVWQATQMSPAAARRTILGSDEPINGSEWSGLTRTEILAKSTLRGALTCVGVCVALLGLSMISYETFVVVFIAQAVYTVAARIMRPRRVDKARHLIDVTTGNTPWAQQWAQRRDQRVAATEQLLDAGAN